MIQEVAERFPEMTLSTLLAAEKKFLEADQDGNGVSLNYNGILLFYQLITASKTTSKRYNTTTLVTIFII